MKLPMDEICDLERPIGALSRSWCTWSHGWGSVQRMVVYAALADRSLWLGVWLKEMSQP